jgi:hypothetical protein
MIRKFSSLWESKKGMEGEISQKPLIAMSLPSIKKLRKGRGYKAFVENLRKVSQNRSKKSHWKYIDALDFKKIFILWIAYIFAFSAVFFFLDVYHPEHGLKNVDIGYDAVSFLNAVYFSFVCATSTGFGDITPIGISRTVAIIEVIGGMIIFGLVISKLISFKQDLILNEIYEISLDGKISGLRSSLYLFKVDLSKLIERVSEGQGFKRRADQLYLLTDTLKETIMDIEKVVCFPNGRRSDFLKSVGPIQLELLINSITTSLDRLSELLRQIDEKQYSWRGEKNVRSIGAVCEIVGEICGYLGNNGTSESIKGRVAELEKSKKELEKQLEKKTEKPNEA